MIDPVTIGLLVVVAIIGFIIGSIESDMRRTRATLRELDKKQDKQIAEIKANLVRIERSKQ